MNIKKDVTLAEASANLTYNAETGLFHWKIAQGKARIGAQAGYMDGCGYIMISVNRKKILAHRLAWLLHTGTHPDGHMDHINGKRDDNRICNLRAVSQAQNNKNLTIRRDNKSGVKGVTFRAGRWRAEIRCEGVIYYLGRFVRLEDAAEVRRKKEKELFGVFARGACV